MTTQTQLDPTTTSYLSHMLTVNRLGIRVAHLKRNYPHLTEAIFEAEFALLEAEEAMKIQLETEHKARYQAALNNPTCRF